MLAQYGEIQKRCSTVIAAQAAEIARLQSQAVRLRAAAMVRETALSWEREDRQAVEAAIPGLPKRLTLARRVDWLMGRVHDLQALVRERLARQRHAVGPPAAATRAQALSASQTAAALHEKSVLCVGQQGAGTSACQHVIELAGGHYLHHAGDDAQDAAALEASLVAADLVICQAGCVSHDAYWRVQDHCRRTGKHACWWSSRWLCNGCAAGRRPSLPSTRQSHQRLEMMSENRLQPFRDKREQLLI